MEIEDGNENEHRETRSIIRRYIPMPAIAIMKSHTVRVRRLAAHLDRLDPDRKSEFLVTFEKNSLVFPEVWGQEHTYVSKMTGCKTSYSLRNGAPPIVRHRGFGDTSMSVETPDWNLLDESVALSRNVAGYEAVGGPPPDDDEEEEEENDDEDEGEAQESDEEEDEDVFDMWTVVQSTRGLEAEKTNSQAGIEGGQVLDLGPMFDQWCGLDEVDES